MTTATAETKHESDTDGHSDQPATTGQSYDDINVPVILMVGLISAILTVATIFFFQGLYYKWQNSYVRERSYDYVNEPVREIVDGQKALLSGEQEGIKSIEETMTEVVEKFGKK